MKLHPPPRKLLGEQAECVFLAEAVRRGFIVSKPYGDSAPYDFIVQRRRPGSPIYRVQVKSVRSLCQRAYRLHVARSLNRPYLPGELDFFALWVAPEDAWYILPFQAVAGHCSLNLCPHRRRSNGRHERYRNAWHLLR